MTTTNGCALAPSEKKCPCKEICPLESALNFVGGKWKIPILCSLHQNGATRYNELKRNVRGITNTMLASSLRELERCGLVLRTQYPEMPVKVEYALTSRCGELLHILQQLANWGMQIAAS